MLKLYNTLTRKKEEFVPIQKGNVGMYVCGPTVYWYQHIGNLRTYVFNDILRRVLSFNGYKVKEVMNVTDVGHLTSDADTGEDKMEKAAKKERKKAEDMANFYWEEFRKDFRKLNISEPDIWCKATRHIQDQIDLIRKLAEKDYTYETSDGIYFDTSKLGDYGKLAMLKKEGLRAGKRIAVGGKKNKTDFALWKFSGEPGKRQQEWKSPWGIGFPGWHIECSAMSMKYLGDNFDIHTGAEDHIPIHHTNEIAQSEAATGKKFVNYWMHAAWLVFAEGKMSKSSGNILTITSLQEKGYNPLDFRYLCLTTHYRTQLKFDFRKLDAAKKAYERLKNIVDELEDDKKTNKKYIDRFKEAINDDLDMPQALAVLWNFLRDKKARGKLNTIRSMDQILGLNLLKKEKIDVPRDVKWLSEQREDARKAKDWKRADELREEIKKKSYVIEDTDKGYKLKNA